MKRYIKYALRNKTLYFVALISMIMAILGDAIVPQIVQRIIDDVIVGGEYNRFVSMLIMMLVLFFVRGFFYYLNEFTADKIYARVQSSVRKDLFRHIQKQNQAFFGENTSGELMSRVRHDAESIAWVFGFIGIFAVQILIHISVMLFFLVRINVYLSIVSLIIMPIIAVLGVFEELKGDKINDNLTDETAEMNKTAGEALTGIRTVKAFNREEHEKKRFGKRNTKFYKLSVKLEYLYSFFDGIIPTLGRIMLALSVLVGAIFVMNDKMTLGQLGASVDYVNNLVWPMMNVGWVIASISQARASARKLNKIFDTNMAIPEKEDAKETIVKGDLAFNNVSISFGEKKVLDDVSFNLPHGSTLGIMGTTGSGKSTIANLALRFIDPDSGSVTMDIEDIRDLRLKNVRAAISIVTQDIFLFSESIKENLTFGQSGKISEEEMIKCAKLADADSFVSKLEEGYETVIGERGIGLSGGQKQRLCIARALLKKAPILLLDDATSALDMETEREVQKAINNFEHKVSKIIIAHRISAVRKADEIIYLEDGKVVERGSHNDLMALRGRYYDTFVVQYSKEEADGNK